MRTEASAELIARARQDRQAFGELYKLYVHRIYAFCLALTRHHEQAEDLTSQTFEYALRTIHRYEDRSVPCSKWLLRIAANAFAAQVRHNHGQGSCVMLDHESLWMDDSASDTDLDPAQIVQQWEQMDWLWGHVCTLSPDHRMVLYLRFWEDRSLADVANQMGRSPSAARQLLYRAMTALRVRVMAGEVSGSDERPGAFGVTAGRRGAIPTAPTSLPRSTHASSGGRGS